MAAELCNRVLLEKDIDWQWHSKQESGWNGIKEILSKHPVLQYYDESKALKVSSDASKDGIGAVLLQETNGEWMPVAYASRSMTKTEKNYATIEKEQLGVVFACERFHVYIQCIWPQNNSGNRPFAVDFHIKEAAV